MSAEFNNFLFGGSEAPNPRQDPEAPLLSAKVKLPRDFSEVVLTLDNALISDDKLEMTPSRLDGVPEDVEIDLRIYGAELIQTSGLLLDLPQGAMATGQVLFQRFYYCKSFVKHSAEVVAMSCIYLASKIEEAPRRIRDVVAVFHHMKQIRLQKNISSLMVDHNYINLKNQVIKEERRLLKELGFCVHVKHSNKMIVMYLQVLEQEKNRRLIQCAWNYVNDSYRTNVFVRYPPETIACACIYLAARKLQIPLPNNPPWYALFGVLESDMKNISLAVLNLYTRAKPNPEALEKRLTELKHVTKHKSSAGVNSSTPNQASTPGTPLEVHRDSPTAITGGHTRSDSRQGGRGGAEKEDSRGSSGELKRRAEDRRDERVGRLKRSHSPSPASGRRKASGSRGEVKKSRTVGSHDLYSRERSGAYKQLSTHSRGTSPKSSKSNLRAAELVRDDTREQPGSKKHSRSDERGLDESAAAFNGYRNGRSDKYDKKSHRQDDDKRDKYVNSSDGSKDKYKSGYNDSCSKDKYKYEDGVRDKYSSSNKDSSKDKYNKISSNDRYSKSASESSSSSSLGPSKYDVTRHDEGSRSKVDAHANGDKHSSGAKDRKRDESRGDKKKYVNGSKAYR